MKREKLSVLIWPVLIMGWIGLSMYGDYTWKDRILKEYETDGWKVFSEQSNAVGVARPWSIFKTPVMGLVFIHPQDWMVLKDGLRVVRTFSVYNKNYTTNEGGDNYYIIDCKNQRYAYFDEDKNRNYLSKLKWYSNYWDLMNYACGLPKEQLISSDLEIPYE